MSEHIFVCPHCLALNNLSNNEFARHASCNICSAILLPESAIGVTEKSFTEFVTHSSLPVIVDFWGAWSGACHEMVDVFNSLSHTFREDALFLRVNSEQEQILANRFKLIDFPTFILFTSGREYHRIQGLVSEHEFHLWLERYLRVKRKKIKLSPPSI